MPAHYFATNKYEEVFDEADLNNKGYISLDDLRRICRKYGYAGPLSQLKVSPTAHT